MMRTEGRWGRNHELGVVAWQDTMALPSHDQLVQLQEFCGASVDGQRMSQHVAT